MQLASHMQLAAVQFRAIQLLHSHSSSLWRLEFHLATAWIQHHTIIILSSCIMHSPGRLGKLGRLGRIILCHGTILLQDAH